MICMVVVVACAGLGLLVSPSSLSPLCFDDATECSCRVVINPFDELKNATPLLYPLYPLREFGQGGAAFLKHDFAVPSFKIRNRLFSHGNGVHSSSPNNCIPLQPTSLHLPSSPH